MHKLSILILSLLFGIQLNAQTNLKSRFTTWLQSNSLDTLFFVDVIEEPVAGYKLLKLGSLAESNEMADAVWMKLNSQYISASGSRFAETLFFAWLTLAECEPDKTAVLIFNPSGEQIVSIRLDDNKQLKIDHNQSKSNVNVELNFSTIKKNKLSRQNEKADKKLIYNQILNYATEHYKAKGATIKTNYKQGNSSLTFDVCNLRGVVLDINKTWICSVINYFFENACDLRAYELLRYTITYEQTDNDYFVLDITVLGRFNPIYGSTANNCAWEKCQPMENTVWGSLLDTHLENFILKLKTNL